jgi:hypothetical protein
MAASIPLADLIPGTNALTIGANQTIVTSNVNIVLVNAGRLPPSVPTGLRVITLLIDGLFPRRHFFPRA